MQTGKSRDETWIGNFTKIIYKNLERKDETEDYGML